MIYFLSSIPRSGSTLLTALLNQRTDTYVSTTSSLCDTMGSAITTWGSNPATHASGGIEEDGIRMLEAIANAHYADHSEPIIIDKGRGWPAPPIMSTMKKVQGDVKIIATVRPIRECLASFVKVANPENVKDFCKNNELANHLFSTYHALKAGYEASPKNFLIIEYKNLVKDPQSQLDRVADFLNIDRQECDPNNVKPVQEDDKIWGIKDLHKVRSKVGRRNYSGKKLLGTELWNFYVGGEFWSDKTEPKKKTSLLDLQLEASLRGDFEKGWELAQQLPEDDDRAAFNRGWYILRQGKLIEGHRLLDRGRDQDVFGNRFGSTQPIWNGESCGTVLLNLEGGLGDQVHGVRWAKDIANRGNKVVVACTADLAPLFVDVEGVSAVVQHEAGVGVYHNAWQPSMSTVIPLGYEYDDLNGQSYIPRFGTSKGKIGLRWSGNPKFEHEQHRLFPSELLFDAVKGHDCISLQRDEGSEFCPDWVERVLLDRWEDTAKAMSSCDLIITSCTSIAHLAGAMGIETWIVVPILSYYIWALPGNKTPYYDSVTLFRQETVENWIAPFEEIKNRLAKKPKITLTTKQVYQPEINAMSQDDYEKCYNSISILGGITAAFQTEVMSRGDYDKAWEIAQHLEEELPNNNHAASNKGWLCIRENKIQEGYKLLERGRIENWWGEKPIESNKPIWNGQTNSTVLLKLERGQGDQFHQVRYARDLAKRGCNVIASCSPNLIEIIKCAEGVSSVINHGEETNIAHDYWLPAMSAIISLGYEQSDLCGDPYISQPESHKEFKIGLCWRGLRHQKGFTNLRVIPPELLFDAVRDYNCISLQRDDGAEYRPSWVEEVPLDSWGNTAKAIASCDLVISCDTSVAHLSAAMGIKTWIIIPIWPYYIWALPGNKTPYYDSVTLFRQETVDNWVTPFDQIRDRLRS